MEKLYKSTRGHQKPLDFYTSILQGIADDGGLLVPDFPFEKKDLNALLSLNYVDLATEVIKAFVPEDAVEDIRKACQGAYDTGLFKEGVVPVEKVGNTFVTELFQGPTAAFKDLALSLLPRFMTLSLKKKGEEREVMILAATSGDTGKAALEGFKDVEGTCIKVFYPIDGVSAIQKRQMVTTTGKNVEVIGIEGNFDDAQTAVKKAFASEELKDLCDQHHVFLSSANSINIGRLIPQIVYYFHSYSVLVNRGEIKLGDQVNFTVPSGNFGDCLAGWIAKNMGLPVNKFIVASNKNNILTDFFKTGVYDTHREFYKTNAPAMDILVSSNLERLVWFMVDGNSEKVDQFYKSLSDEGVYHVDEETLARIQKEFVAGCQSEEQVLENIKDCYDKTHYLLDTHTAVGYGVYNEYVKETGDKTPNVLLATASPYKFPESVYEALTEKKTDVFTAIDALNEMTDVEIPYPLKGLKERETLHEGVIAKDHILSFIGERIKEF
jgi:threonine synthase